MLESTQTTHYYVPGPQVAQGPYILTAATNVLPHTITRTLANGATTVSTYTYPVLFNDAQLRRLLRCYGQGSVPRNSASSPCVVSGGTPFQLQQTCDLAGSPNQLIQTAIAGAVPAIQLSHNYDGAGRLNNVQSNWDGTPNSTNPVNLFTVQSSGPAGPQNWSFGNYLSFQKTYDTRFRPTSEVVTHP